VASALTDDPADATEGICGYQSTAVRACRDDLAIPCEGGPAREVVSLMNRSGDTVAPSAVAAAPAADWSRLVVWLLLAVWVFNVADFVLTADALQAGRAEELNPLMDALFGLGLLPVALYKIGVVTGGVLALWLLRRHRIVLYAAGALAVFLGLIVVYHIVGLWMYAL